MQVSFPSQTKEGIVDSETFFLLRIEISRVTSSLFSTLSTEKMFWPFFEHMNCHVLAEAFQTSFVDYKFRKCSGYFGAPKIGEKTVSQYVHSWLVAPSAPGWVVDVSPFNGLLSANIVAVESGPWRGLYREGNPEGIELTEVQLRCRNGLIELIKAIRAPLPAEATQ